MHTQELFNFQDERIEGQLIYRVLLYSDPHLHKSHLTLQDLLGVKSQDVNPDLGRKEIGDVEREVGRGAEET